MTAHAVLETLNPIVWTNGTVTIRYREANNDGMRIAADWHDAAEQLDLVRAFSGVRIEGDPEGAVRELVDAAWALLTVRGGPTTFASRVGELKQALARFEVAS